MDKPFNTVDNKYYFVIWKNDNWSITKFRNNEKIKQEKILEQNGKYYELKLKNFNSTNYEVDLFNIDHRKGILPITRWITDNGTNFKAVYRWKIANEPNTPIIDPQTGQITDWNLKNKNNINRNSEIKVTVKNKDVSENPVYQLEANYFNWLSITNELETNNIPSLIPAEIKLSDGEYGKYLTNLIVSNDKLEECLNYFSQWYRLLYSKAAWMNMTKNLVVDSVKIAYDVKLFALNQIEISGIWGYGIYDITIFTEKEQININNLQLFNKNNEKLSLISLEI